MLFSAKTNAKLSKYAKYNLVSSCFCVRVRVTLIFIKLFLIKRKAYWNKPNHTIKFETPKPKEDQYTLPLTFPAILGNGIKNCWSMLWKLHAIHFWSTVLCHCVPARQTHFDWIDRLHHRALSSQVKGRKSIFKTKARNELFLRPIPTIICKQYYQIWIFPHCIHFRQFQGERRSTKPFQNQCTLHIHSYTHKSNDNFGESLAFKFCTRSLYLDRSSLRETS